MVDVGQRAQRRGLIGRTLAFIGRAVRNYFIFIGVLVTVLPILLTYALTSSHKFKDDGASSRLSAAHPTRLHLVLGGKIAQREPGFTDQLFERFFKSERDLYLPDLRATLRRAAKDARISQLEVEIGPLSGSPADFTELRRILADTREAGKKVNVVMSDAEDWTYYVASAANRIVLNPASPVTIPGPTFQLIYFGEALKKLGVEIDVVRAGKYKSAFEPFVQNAPSPATLEEYESMQKSLLDHIVGLVAKGRAKDEATVRAWYKRSIYTPAEALQAGIVDSLGYAADETQPGKDKADNKPMSVAEYRSATGKDSEDASTGHGGLGLIEAVGEINLTESNSASQDGITPRALTKQIQWALNDDDVKAVVLRVSSPGGSAIASDLIWNELKTLAAAKPLVVSMGAYAASGGYYISVPAKYIVAEPTTVTGSIGVIGMMPSVKAFEEKYGVSFHIVSSSDRRNMLNIGSKATPEDKALIDGTIDQVYRTFVQKVAEGRKLAVGDVEKLAQGRVYTGLQAKELGLVDEIGGLQAAFTQAKKLAGLDPNKLYPIQRYDDDNLNLSDCLSGPMKMMKCMDKGDAHVQVGTFIQRAGLGWTPPPVATAADFMTRWLGTSAHEGPLALWPAYLGAGWQ